MTHLLDRRHTGTSLVEAFRALGLNVDNVNLETALVLLGGRSIDAILRSNTAPDEIVKAWEVLMRSMANRNQNDSVVPLVALAAMTDLFIHEEEKLGDAIKSRGWNVARTASEASLRLFGTEFTMSRKLVPDQRSRSVGRALLVEAIATSAHVSLRLHNQSAQLRFYGMRGVGYLLLARGEFSPSKLALLEAASADLAESRRLGDHSAQHAEYEIEALLRRNQVQPSTGLLNKADILLKEVGVISRRLAYNAGDICLHRGIQAMAECQHEEALVQYQGAVDAYSTGIQITRRPLDMEDGDIRAKRGYARLRAFYAASKLAIATTAEELNGIISDLECGVADASGLSPLPEALLWRAAHFRTSGHLDLSIQDLTRAIELSPVDAGSHEIISVLARVRCQLAECRLEVALEGEDTTAVESSLRELLAVDAAFDPSIPLLSKGIRQIVLDRGHHLSASLIREVASKLRVLMSRPHCTGSVRAFAASYMAGVLFRLGDLIDEPELREVCELYTLAVDESEDQPAPEVLALAGDAKLKLAKVLLVSGSNPDECLFLLEDAVELFGAGIAAIDHASDAYDEKVAHSKLGEAFLRLGSLTGDPEYAEAAAQHLEHSRLLGNDAPELLGLLGDCYYRIGRAKKDIAELRRAADLKACARTRAAKREEYCLSVRENWSLTARIEESIWKIGGDKTSLAAAISAGLRAHTADPQWPWPIFQLAAMCRAFGDEFKGVVSLNENAENIDVRLAAALRDGTAESLEALGAELSVQNEEFRRRVLGGRTQVYVLDDTHGLLSETVVLKRNTTINAEREAADALSFAQFLRLAGTDSRFSVARPLAIVPVGDFESVYAMQHMKGWDLGSLIVRGLHVGRPVSLDICMRVVDFLAWFHAWSWRDGIGARAKPPHELERVAQSIALSWTQAGSSKNDADNLRTLLIGLLPAWTVNFRKKDAHPENWLVTPSGEIVLIDLESTKLLPALYDLWQLLDDYPLLGVYEEGMQRRMDLLMRYYHHLTERIPELDKDQLVEGDLWTTSCGFILFRAAFGLARLLHRGRAIGTNTTSSALRSVTVRREHYRKLIDWFAREEADPKVAACARHLAIMAQHLDSTIA